MNMLGKFKKGYYYNLKHLARHAWFNLFGMDAASKGKIVAKAFVPT